MTVTTIPTAGIADDAVGNTKLDLSENYAFTGTVTGAGGGKVLQIQSRSFNDNSNTTSTSAVASPFEHTITPSATSSKVMILIDGGRTSYGSGACEGTTWLYRSVGGGSFSEVVRMKQGCRAGGSDGYGKTSIAFNYLHSPSTTSALIYKVYFRTNSNNWYLNSDNSRITITLLEIEA